MKMEEIKGKTAEELKNILLSLKRDLFVMRFQRATGELENTSKIRSVRREIARVMTGLNVIKVGA